jgi:hypothetical protein
LYPPSSPLLTLIKLDFAGSLKACRCVILEAALYREDIVLCTTPQQFYNNLNNTFRDIRRATADNTVDSGLVCAIFLLTWIDFLRADFNSFNCHMKGVIVLLRSYKNSLNGKPFPSTVCYALMVTSMFDACIAFFGGNQPFPIEVILRDHSWLDIYVHRDEIPRALIHFSRGEWMRTIANFRRWARTQRATGDFEDPFIEEAIERQGNAITSDIVAWADRSMPKYIETPATNPAEGNSDYTPYSQQPISSFNPHQFLQYPRVQFQNRAHNEMILIYFGLLLLVSYSTYPQSGHLPFLRRELAVKFCQCFAAYPEAEDMDPVNRVLHLFYARLTFDDSSPQGIKLFGISNRCRAQMVRCSMV